MSDIFISYASEDRERIQPLVRALEQAGWSVFWDRTIPAGKTWREVIGGEIRDARFHDLSKFGFIKDRVATVALGIVD